jgi:hypothetical protein
LIIATLPASLFFVVKVVQVKLILLKFIQELLSHLSNARRIEEEKSIFYFEFPS